MMGTAGNDTLIGGEDADEIFGLAGNDLIEGNGGSDSLFGGEGNDTLISGAGAADVLDGGANDDLIEVSTLNNSATVNGGGGFDTLQVQDGAALFFTLIEDPDAQGLIFSNGNGSNVTAFDIEILLIGSRELDVVYGTTGADLLAAVDNTDAYIVAGQGNDTVSGGDGDDIIIGARTFFGGANPLFNSAKLINGGAGDDTILVGEDNDTVHGGDGDDNIQAGDGEDLITLGAGQDTVTGGPGSDTVSYVDASGAIGVNLLSGIAETGGFLNAGGFYQGGAAEDVLVSIENLTGTQFSDRLIADNGANLIDGGDGNDRLSGLNGNDILIGGAGFDTLEGGNGIDTVDYSASDTGIGANLFAGSVESGGFLNASGFYQSGSLEDDLSSIENITGSAFADRLIANSGVNHLDGGAGDDRISAFGGDDTLIGADGFDTLEGGNGSDTADYSGSDTGIGANLFAGSVVSDGFLNADGFYQGGSIEDVLSSIENLTGSAFADRLIADNSDNRLDGGAGNDRISAFGGNDLVIGGNGNDTLEGGVGFDTLEGGAGSDTVDYSALNSGIGANLINGAVQTGGFLNAGGFYQGGVVEDSLVDVENIIGTGFADRLIADNGDNRLDGGDGNDRISGFNGNDTIIGGAGDDTLEGGGGDDLFIINANDGDDVISGFVAGAGGGDVIELVGFGANLDTFADIAAVASQSGDDTVIDLGNGETLTILDTLASSLSVDDFLFG